MSEAAPQIDKAAIDPSAAATRVLHSNHGTFSTLTPVVACTSQELVTELYAKLQHTVAAGERVIAINLSKTVSGNSVLLTALLDCALEVQRIGGTLRLVQVSPLLAKALEITRLAEQLIVIEDHADAGARKKLDLTPGIGAWVTYWWSKSC